MEDIVPAPLLIFYNISKKNMKYSDLMCKWLKQLGYTHCFYLAGGNIMHLLESASRHFTCVPTVHEVAAGVAAEYLNETSSDKKAFVLVTAGPGLTNVMTAIGGAFLEGRELLVVGGQVKTSDLSHGDVRQRGIQEIDGVAITKPITKESVRLDKPAGFSKFSHYVNASSSPRKGPVFIEMPLDVQGAIVDEAHLTNAVSPIASHPLEELLSISDSELNKISALINGAKRPMILIGGGVDRSHIDSIENLLSSHSIPIVTTWNAADRVDSRNPLYFGRPNTWGMRYSNILLQQSDLLIAVGTRLGMQQTGFNWQEFIPNGKIVQVDCDLAELNKGHPTIDIKVHADANHFLLSILKLDLGSHSEWLDFCTEVKTALPLVEDCNNTDENYISPYYFHEKLSSICTPDDIIIPCSSGSAFTVTYQSFLQKKGQVIISDKSLASMGYGLSGAIGAAISASPKRTILIEGDGGFAQNLQEIGTAAINKLNLKIFIFDDNGYASIRMTQSNYFGGKYLGCDTKTGLGLPDWEKIFSVYDVPCLRLEKDFTNNSNFTKLFESDSISAFIVPIDPKQTYFPKITSRVTENGSMESNPIHIMTPELPTDIMSNVSKFLKSKE